VVCALDVTDVEGVVLSGGVIQNEVLVDDIVDRLATRTMRVWTNHYVPLHDDGPNLGQAALALAVCD
jgi:hydrogenase maturation protein HypF